ncbi:hypothetical protein CKO44_20590 [Rubrivivax gelatinosus]|uniref:toll/interleukin-1 receptor domain-containing protein n=1 Tax=Rubrivivax gelatinosus TaxID=28068 RepID=UPI0019035AE5|nr:toll/interleukin-1 receptor domain-containing protein [Rubrivivax gelatinosus]MBK1615855.1 hypothetical protein [Rubrivivax gelatinosus]
MALADLARILAALRTFERGCGLDVGRRLGLMRLADALDYLQAMLALAPDAAPRPHPALRAEAEFDSAWQELGTSLPAELRAEIAALRPELGRAVATLAGTTRGGAEAAALASVAATGAPLPPDASLQARPDDARFGACAPASVQAGRSFVADFVAYPAAERERAQALLTRPNATLDIGAAAPLLRGTRLDVEAGGIGIELADGESARQSFLWLGTPVKLSWALRATADAGDSAVLRLDVGIDGIVVARVRLEIGLTAAPPSPAAPPAQVMDEPIVRRAFASYASADRLRVLDRVAAIRLAAGIEVFLDCHDLHPGRNWRAQLERELDGADLFLLFWSEAAAQSGWVRWEYERALQHPGEAHMQIHPLDNGVAPPRALAHLHLGDPYMDLRAAERLRRSTTAA